MNTKNYFNLQLNVSFTMSELMTISSAIFDSWESDKKHDWNESAKIKLEIREKLQKQINMYNEIIK